MHYINKQMHVSAVRTVAFVDLWRLGNSDRVSKFWNAPRGCRVLVVKPAESENLIRSDDKAQRCGIESALIDLGNVNCGLFLEVFEIYECETIKTKLSPFVSTQHKLIRTTRVCTHHRASSHLLIAPDHEASPSRAGSSDNGDPRLFVAISFFQSPIRLHSLISVTYANICPGWCGINRYYLCFDRENRIRYDFECRTTIFAFN